MSIVGLKGCRVKVGALVVSSFVIMLGLPSSLIAADRPVGADQPRERQDLVFRGGAVASDNIGRDERDESGIVSVAGVTANLAGERSALEWSVTGTLDYFDYGIKEYDDEVVGSAVAAGALRFFDERLKWNFSNEFGQLRSNSLAAEGPNNRARFNVIETGPTIELPLSSVTAVLLDARYAERSFEKDGQVDSGVTTVQAGVVRALSAERTLGVFASARQIDFDSALAADYEVNSEFVRFTQALRDRDSVTVDLGQNRLKPDGGDESSGLFARVSASQKIGARSRLVLRAVQDYQDAGYALRDTIGTSSGSGADQVGLTSDPMERRSLGADFNVTWTRTQLGLMAEVANEAYEVEQQRDRDATIFGVSVGRSLSPEMRISLRTRLRREEFSNSDETANEHSGDLTLSRRLSRSFALALSYQVWDRESDTQGTITENRLMLTLQYLPWGESSGVPSLIR